VLLLKLQIVLNSNDGTLASIQKFIAYFSRLGHGGG